MSECSSKQIKNEKTVRRWHSWFKKYNSFPHPNHYVQMQLKAIPKIFEDTQKQRNLWMKLHQQISKHFHLSQWHYILRL